MMNTTLNEKYVALKHVVTGSIYVPFYKVTSKEGSKIVYTPYITNGAKIKELKKWHMEKFEEIEIDKNTFINATGLIDFNNNMQNCKEGDLFLYGGYIMILERFQLSDEYMNTNGLKYKERFNALNPLYFEKYNTGISGAWQF